jgi:hypothetical protein
MRRNIDIPGVGTFEASLSNGDTGDVILTPVPRKRGKAEAKAVTAHPFGRRPKIAARKALAGRSDITLSAPGKMPSYGWSLPAGKACPASKATITRHGSAAICDSCYAKGGNYLFPNVRRSLDARMSFVVDSLKADNGDTFVRTMIDMVSRAVKVTGPYFRIHDSGDFFHPLYVDCWRRVAEALPDVRFWAPTREWLRPMMRPSLEKLAALPNVTIRPSAEALEHPAPVVPGLACGSAVSVGDIAGHRTCPATTDIPQCDAHGCRACWDMPLTPITYRLH